MCWGRDNYGPHRGLVANDIVFCAISTADDSARCWNDEASMASDLDDALACSGCIGVLLHSDGAGGFNRVLLDVASFRLELRGRRTTTGAATRSRGARGPLS